MDVGQRLEQPAAKPVGARVPNVTDGYRLVPYQGGRDRRAHSRGLGVFPGTLIDAPVRFLDDRRDTFLRLELVRVVELAESVDRQPRGHLACLRSAHAVRD